MNRLPKILDNIKTHEWRFAKTMPKNPHWYTLRKDWKDEEFVEFVLFIREHGYETRFGGRKYIKFNINGYEYWTMGADINTPDGKPYTILINRAKHHYNTLYDEIFETYDDMFNDEQSIIEDKQLFELIKPTGKILDIGCGTGLFQTYHPTSDYVGLDNSIEALNRFKIAYPELKKHLVNSTVEDFHTKVKFDTILAMYGIGSYLTDTDIEKLKTLLNAGGRMIIMFYKDEYYPKTYENSGINPECIVDQNYKDDTTDFNNYLIYTYENR